MMERAVDVKSSAEARIAASEATVRTETENSLEAARCEMPGLWFPTVRKVLVPALDSKSIRSEWQWK
jgi:hypothetical protein